MKKCCIVFDVDGTLFDTKKGIIHTLNTVLETYGKKEISKSDEAKYIGPSVKKAMIEYQSMDETDATEATALYRKHYVEHFVHESSLYDGVPETLDLLKERGYLLGIATMKTRPQLNALLQDYDCENYFSILKTAKEDGSLSKTQMLKDIKKAYPEHDMFVLVGDTMGDYQAAKEAGYEFVVADYGYGNMAELDTRHISRFSELLEECSGQAFL